MEGTEGEVGEQGEQGEQGEKGRGRGRRGKGGGSHGVRANSVPFCVPISSGSALYLLGRADVSHVIRSLALFFRSLSPFRPICRTNPLTHAHISLSHRHEHAHSQSSSPSLLSSFSSSFSSSSPSLPPSLSSFLALSLSSSSLRVLSPSSRPAPLLFNPQLGYLHGVSRFSAEGEHNVVREVAALVLVCFEDDNRLHRRHIRRRHHEILPNEPDQRLHPRVAW